MIKTKRYINLMVQLTGDKKDNPVWKVIGLMRKEYNLTRVFISQRCKTISKAFFKKYRFIYFAKDSFSHLEVI